MNPNLATPTCAECGLPMPFVGRDRDRTVVTACCNADCRRFHKLVHGRGAMARSSRTASPRPAARGSAPRAHR